MVFVPHGGHVYSVCLSSGVFQNGLISALIRRSKSPFQKRLPPWMRKICRDGKLTLDNVGQTQPETVSCDAGHFLQGMLWDTYGASKRVTWGTGREGYSTQSDKDSGEEWRTYSQSILIQMASLALCAVQSLDVLLTMRNCAVNTLEFPAFICRLWRIFIIQPRLAPISENYTDCAEISMISGGRVSRSRDETAAGSYL